MKISAHQQVVEIRYSPDPPDNDPIKISDIMVWAHDHCASYTRHRGFVDYNSRELVYLFYLGDDKDMAHFLLRWQ